MYGLTQQQARFRESVESVLRTQIAGPGEESGWDDAMAPIEALASTGWMTAFLAYDGRDALDLVSYGAIHELTAALSASMQSLLTVHGMVTKAVSRWGSPPLKDRWLPRLHSGDCIAGFALTEAGAGSDAAAIEANLERVDDHFVLTGHKRWVSFGQIADVFLTFARCGDQHAAVLIDRSTPGLNVRPSPKTLGLRASRLADLEFDGCAVPQDQLVGRIGFGISLVASVALTHGRFCVAWGALGIAEEALRQMVCHAESRRTFGRFLSEHQLVRRHIAESATRTEAARLLCRQAAHSYQSNEPDSVYHIHLAKYAAAEAAVAVADLAVRIVGARGLEDGHPVQRLCRDAHVLEIIEGATEILQLLISDDVIRRHKATSAREDS